MTTNLKPTSVFGERALALDNDFCEFGRLASEMEGIDIQSDLGFDKARKLLAKLDTTGKRIGDGMVGLTTSLEEVRQRTEAAAQLVSERAAAVEKRQNDNDRMVERLHTLGNLVKQVTEAVAKLRASSADAIAAEPNELGNKLPEFSNQLGVLVDETKKLIEDAQAAKMTSLERNADSLRQTLQAARNRLNLFIERSRGEQVTH